jgi:hypothetical protein
MARLVTYLVVEAPGQPQQVVLWDTLDITVGRGQDRDVVIAHSEISRQHCVFQIEKQTYTVADLHTSNGTYVNGARVARHALRPGDVVEIGPARICFRQEPESPRGKHVHFASQLKGFSPIGGGEADGNRTVLGITPSMNGPLDQGDYADRLPTGEQQFDWSSGDEEGSAPQEVVNLDPVLDSGLEEVELAAFEDAELGSFEEEKGEAAPPPAAPARAPVAERPAATRAAPAPPPSEARTKARAPAAAPARAPAPAAPRAPAPAAAAPRAPASAPAVAAPRAPEPAAAPRAAPTPSLSPRAPAAPARAAQARPAAAPAAKAPERAPVSDAEPAPGAEAEAAAAVRSAEAPALPEEEVEPAVRAILAVEIQGPRTVLRAVVNSLLDREIEIPPLRLRLRRPDDARS